MYQNKNLVRIPFWVNSKEVRSWVSGKELSAVRIGNFLMFEDPKPGDKILLQFPIREDSAEYKANSRTEKEQTYKCTFRGSTLVDVST